MIARLRFTILPSIVRWRRDFGQDGRVVALSYRSWALWLLGYPEAARSDAEHALEDAREIGQAATLMYRAAPRNNDPYLSAEITRQPKR